MLHSALFFKKWRNTALKCGGDIKVLNVRMDNLERNLEKSNKVVMWIAAVYAVPMLFMMYQILAK